MDKEEEEQGEDRGLDGQPSPPPSVAAPGAVGAAVATAAAAAAVAVFGDLAPQWRRRRQGGFLSLAAGVDDVRLLTFGRHRCSTSDSERKRNQDFNVCLTNTDCERTLL